MFGLCAATLLLLVAVFNQKVGAQNLEQQKPNIVVILADDMGWNDVGYHGSEIKTPTLDRLAAQGVRFTNFYVQPSCSPTRSSLLTGQSSVRLGVIAPISKNAQGGLPLNVRILPQYLKEAGYQTALTGKWHLGHARKSMHPNARGFDHFYGHVTGGVGYWDHVHGGGYDWQRNGETVREEGYTTHLIADEAVHLIETRDASKPLFLYLALNAPHLPNEAPEETVAQYSDIENVNRRLHAAMVTELDTAIGRVMEALEKAGMADNTLVWFMSDNGGLNPSAVSEGLLGWMNTLTSWFGRPLPLLTLEFIRTNAEDGAADNTPLRGGKGTVWEGGMRVPSFVHWPAKLAPTQISSRVTVQDVMPTLLSAIEYTPALSAPLDGADQWPRIADGQATEIPDLVTLGYFGDAYFHKDWKLVVLSEDQVELYNLADDPLEQKDLFADEPDIVAQLQEKMAKFPRGEPVNPPLWRILFDPDFFGGAEDRAPWADVIED